MLVEVTRSLPASRAQGAEFEVLSSLLTAGLLCRLHTVVVEFHDERRHSGHMIPILEAAGPGRCFLGWCRVYSTAAFGCCVHSLTITRGTQARRAASTTF